MRYVDWCNMMSVDHPMTKQLCIPILLGFLLGLTAPASSLADDEADEVDKEDVRNCISTRKLTSTRVLDDQNIFFIMIGNIVFHNKLPKQCKGLASEGNFSYGTLAGSMCKFDAIRVTNSFGDMGRSCVLGEFRKVDGDDIRAIVEGRPAPKAQPLPPAEVEDIDSATDESPESTSD